jgi:hypothetical protein
MVEEMVKNPPTEESNQPDPEVVSEARQAVKDAFKSLKK